MTESKTIKIFLASSEELKNDRNAFGNFVRRLDDIYEKRGIRVKLFPWEDADAAYNNRRKQDEYNDEVRASDMFLALFYKKAGKFTIEEFDVAVEEYNRTKKKPKNYVYCRELKDGEQESPELTEFKSRLSNELEYFWYNYNHEDSLQLHFVMQLQLVENKRLDELKVEDGEVTLGGTTIARMDNLRFAADNPDYQRMRQRLMELPALIEKASLRKDKYPDDEDLRDELQKLLDERNNLQEVFKQQQELLFDTAKRIAQLCGEQITDRMRRAIEAFDRGDVHEANIILDEAKHDAVQNLTDYRQSRAFTEQKRQIVIKSIEELLLNASTMMADPSIDIKERKINTRSLYAQADEMATEIEYDKENYSHLLFGYAQFLYKYGLYRESEAVWLRQIPLSEELYGIEHEYTATSYNNIGAVYQKQGNYPKALEYYFKALEIEEKKLGTDHPSTATFYNNIGAVYDAQGDYPKALEFHFKALEIRENIFGKEHALTATSYNSIGEVYRNLGNYRKALEYYFKALNIAEKQQELDYPCIAGSYNNIGLTYNELGDYPKSLIFCFKAIELFEKELGTDHADTAQSYNNIGLAYNNQGNYFMALFFFSKALKIREKIHGTDHPDTATSYNNIGVMYDAQGDYPKALEFHFQALETREKILGKEHPSTATSYNNIGALYYKMKDFNRALEYLNKALKILKDKLGPDHPNAKTAQESINIVLAAMGKG